MSGLILMGELLMVPLCMAILVDAIAWLQRDRDEPPRPFAAPRPA